MKVQLSKKERMLLEDEKTQEELCVAKYKSYAQQAQDPQLKQLFTKLANEEQKHYDTVNQLLQGFLPASSQGQSGSQLAQQAMQSGQTPQLAMEVGQMGGQMGQQATKNASGSSSDKMLCIDMLSTEKYVSNTYDTAIFESASAPIRQALQQIQKDEQGHGEQIFQYMNSNGMYQVK